LSALLVTAELSLAVVLLAGAGVMVRSFLNVYTADIGVDRTNAVTLFLNLPDRYDGAEAQVSFYDRLATRFDTIPGIESVAMASSLPAGGARRVAYEVVGAPVAAERIPPVSAVIVGPDYFRTVRAPVLAGREFTDVDRASGAPAAVVNQQFARMHWPGDDAVGKRLRVVEGPDPAPWLTVVGVVSNVVQDVTRQATEPIVYLPYRQRPAGNMWIIARTAAAPGALANSFRREVAALDPDLPIGTGPFTLDERLAGMGNYWVNGSHAALLLIFGAVALLLASLGLYAVVAHGVSQRTQEIGLRMAIGATSRDIVALVAQQAMVPAGIGLVIGLAGSMAVNRLLRSELVQVAPTDPLTLALVAAVLVFSAALGCWVPARRAMRVDPVVALAGQ
jgi:putative ABC transport system permease protein